MTKNQIFDQKAKIYEKLENFTQKYKCRLKVEKSAKNLNFGSKSKLSPKSQIEWRPLNGLQIFGTTLKIFDQI